VPESAAYASALQSWQLPRRSVDCLSKKTRLQSPQPIFSAETFARCEIERTLPLRGVTKAAFVNSSMVCASVSIAWEPKIQRGRRQHEYVSLSEGASSELWRCNAERNADQLFSDGKYVDAERFKKLASSITTWRRP
jgi:hypothetical protein